MPLKSVGWLGAFVFATAILVTGCANSAHVQKDTGANLSQYKTYGWVEKKKDSGASHMNDMAEQNLRDAVNEALKDKGFKQVRNSPDLMISTDLILEKNLKQQSDPVYSQDFTRTYLNPRTGRYTTFYYPSQFLGYNNYATTIKEGTIIVTMIDTKTDRAVWQGWGTKLLNSHNSISKGEINNNVRAIFRKFKA